MTSDFVKSVQPDRTPKKFSELIQHVPADRIREIYISLRTKMQLKQADVARILGVTQAAVSGYECGTSMRFRPATMEKLALTLDAWADRLGIVFSDLDFRSASTATVDAEPKRPARTSLKAKTVAQNIIANLALLESDPEERARILHQYRDVSLLEAMQIARYSVERSDIQNRQR